MANKKNFALRMDEDLYKALEKWANDEFRSVNGQLEWLIHQRLKELGRIKPGPGGKGQEEEKPDDTKAKNKQEE